MTIKELRVEFPEVYKLAIKNTTHKSNSLTEAFIWSGTKQGHKFWDYFEMRRVDDSSPIPEKFLKYIDNKDIGQYEIY